MKKKILILGGTQFVGRTIVESFINSDQFDITLFNRQVSNSQLFPNVSKLKGDRESSDINQIARTKWDVIVDVSCYFPKALEAALEAVNGQSPHYILISTCSVYNSARATGELNDESAPLLHCSEEQALDRTDATYGERKAECERILERSGLAHTILRPALVVGPYDNTDRLYFWLYHLKKQNRLVVPSQENFISMTSSRHLADCVLHAVENRVQGNFNAISYSQISILNVLDSAAELLGVPTTSDRFDNEDFHRAQIREWMDLPLWIAGNHFTYSNKKLVDTFGAVSPDFNQMMGEMISFFDNKGWPEPTYGMGLNEMRKRLLT